MRIRRRSILIAALILGPFSAQARDPEVIQRFLERSRELRQHRSEMIARFSQEKPLTVDDPGKGLRLYLRWAPPNQEKLRNLSVSFEAQDKLARESIPIREEHNWGLLWYSALLPQPHADVGVLRIKADVESKHFRTPFQAVREVNVFEGTLPLVLNSLTGPLRIVVELDSDSPFSERKRSERSLKLSLLPKQETSKTTGLR